jgi:hypothetical protein
MFVDSVSDKFDGSKVCANTVVLAANTATTTPIIIGNLFSIMRLFIFHHDPYIEDSVEPT